MSKFIDLTGNRYGRLTALECCGKTRDRHSLWLCKCDCGNEKIVSGNSLKSGLTKSCGCLNHDATMERNLRHGGCYTRLYNIWKNMKARCTNTDHPRFKDYGERGIAICDEWKNSFYAFRKWSLQNGYTEELTIDRIDNDGNYEPGNCRWATYAEQNRNKRGAIKGNKVDIYVNSHQEAVSRGKVAREVFVY